MSDQSQLLKRAARLFALALKAREEGHLEYAERLTQRASEILDQPTALERLGTQTGQRSIERATQATRSAHGRRPIGGRAGWDCCWATVAAGPLRYRANHRGLAAPQGPALACAEPLHCTKNSQLRGFRKRHRPRRGAIRRHCEPLSLQPLGLSTQDLQLLFLKLISCDEELLQFLSYGF